MRATVTAAVRTAKNKAEGESRAGEGTRTPQKESQRKTYRYSTSDRLQTMPVDSFTARYLLPVKLLGTTGTQGRERCGQKISAKSVPGTGT